MSIKKGTAPKTIATDLTINSMGESLQLAVTYYNRTNEEMRSKVESGATVGEIVLFIVKEWDSDFALTLEGLDELENERTGTSLAVWQGFNQARASSLTKN